MIQFQRWPFTVWLPMLWRRGRGFVFHWLRFSVTVKR